MNKILLVEDDYLDAMAVQRVFSKANISSTFTIVRNGREALDLLHGKEANGIHFIPDVILLDINMPKMNGLEFLEELRDDSDPRLRKAKVFIMTTSGEETERTRAETLGIQGYIVKPLSFESFENPNSSMGSFSLLIELLKDGKQS